MRHLLVFIFLLTASNIHAQNKDISLEDIWRDHTFDSKSPMGFNALPDGLNYTDLKVDSPNHIIQIHTLSNGTDGVVLYKGNLPVSSYLVNSKQNKLLLLCEPENIYRRSILYKVYVYDVATANAELLDNGKVLHPCFSPDGTKVAYVKNNNLYFKDIVSGTNVKVTSDGERNKIINGNCDWVYEEEFEFTQAFQWSPDSKHLAYYRFDESNVQEYTMTRYDQLYPTPYKYKYPKAGESNSIVDIGIFDLATQKSVKAELYNDDGSFDYYIPRIKWSNDPSQLCIYKLNRRQNQLILFLADAATAKTQRIYTEDNKAYIEINDNLEFLPDGHSILFTSEQDGWNHLYTWDWKSKQLKLLTKGDYDLDALIGVDPGGKTVYYTAAENSARDRNLFSIDLNGKHKTQLTMEPGFHAITGIEGNHYFMDRYSNLHTPAVYTLRDNTGKIIRTLEDNAALKSKLSEYRLGNISFMQIPGASGTLLNAWRIVPPGFDSTKKYPVLMYQYSGPGSQEVSDKFPAGNFLWHQLLAEKGYIVICADGTGTGFQGEAFRKKTYLQLGKYESDDQIAVARYLGGLAYVDKNRIGIWGWSFGGFMSSTCIMKGADVFKMAIAVAPVTNWRYYDNIYTERYMRLPSENKEGYDNNAPENMAGKLKGKFLLIHGTGDDNVHFQNSVMLVNNLIKENKDYDAEFYPDRSHGIAGGNTRLHLYRRMTQFVLDNL